MKNSLDEKLHEKIKRRKGFTLIEMMVVIGIISVLAAITLPVIFRARGQARSVACLSNLRQIGKAFYLADERDVMNYIGNYENYLDSMHAEGIANCPAAKEKPSYGVNSYLLNYHGSIAPDTFVMADSKGKSVVHSDEDIAYRHNDGANALFADGHAKWVKNIMREMWTPQPD